MANGVPQPPARWGLGVSPIGPPGSTSLEHVEPKVDLAALASALDAPREQAVGEGSAVLGSLESRAALAALDAPRETAPPGLPGVPGLAAPPDFDQLAKGLFPGVEPGAAPGPLPPGLGAFPGLPPGFPALGLAGQVPREATMMQEPPPQEPPPHELPGVGQLQSSAMVWDTEFSVVFTAELYSRHFVTMEVIKTMFMSLLFSTKHPLDAKVRWSCLALVAAAPTLDTSEVGAKMVNLIVQRLRELSKQVHYTAPTRQHLQQVQKIFNHRVSSTEKPKTADVQLSSLAMLQQDGAPQLEPAGALDAPAAMGLPFSAPDALLGFDLLGDAIPKAPLLERGVSAPAHLEGAPDTSRLPMASGTPPLPMSVEEGGRQRLTWTVTEKVLRSTNKVAVSPPYTAFDAQWRLMLQPEVTHSSKGGQSFKAAKGRAIIKLKCEGKPEANASAAFAFQFIVGSHEPRGPCTHNFTETAIAALPADDVWDVLDNVRLGMVTICADIWPVKC